MQYRCTCGFIYDDHIGDPNRGIEPMPFAKVPEAWTCPLCGLDKDVFAPYAAAPKQTASGSR